MIFPDPPDPARHHRAKQLFLDALDVPPGEREAFVASRAGGEQGLREEVMQLLALHGGHDSVLDATPDPTAALFESPGAGHREVGDYRLLRPLGRGGMGIVFLARRGEESPVALKLLAGGFSSAATRARFRREAAILARLDHAGVSRLLDAGEVEGGPVPRPWIAMEYVEAEPLLAFAAARALPLRDRVELLARICDAVAHAHALGIVHRDLKPENILVRGDGRPVVLDFGVARLLEDEAGGSRLLTQAGVLVGTPQYMSPEQVQAEPATVGPPSDVYSLGVVAYELLAGRVPYEAGTVSLHRAVVAVLTSDPPGLGARVPEAKGPLERIVAKALEKRPADRYAEAGALAADLRRWLAGRTVRVRGPGVLRRVARWSRRRRALAVGAAATVLALAFGATWWLAGRAPDPERVRAAHAAAETNLFRAVTLIHQGDRTPGKLRAATEMLTAAREGLRRMPSLSHRGRLEHALAEQLGTAEMLLGELEWDVALCRAATLHLQEALRHPLEGGNWERHVTVPEILTELRSQTSHVTRSILALAFGALADLWGEHHPHHRALYHGQEALRETLLLLGPPPAAGPGLAPDPDDPYVFRYNDLAEACARLADFEGDPALAALAVSYSDSAFARRERLRQNWPALGSVLFQRGRAWLALAEFSPGPGTLDSARRNLRRSLAYRGPERPHVFAETHETLAASWLLEAGRVGPDRGRPVALRRGLGHLDSARSALAAGARPEPLARLRSLRAEVLGDLALAERDPGALRLAEASLDSNASVFTFARLPRHFALDQVRRARLARVRATLTGDPAAREAAREALASARDHSTVRADSLVLRRVRLEGAALASGPAGTR